MNLQDILIIPGTNKPLKINQETNEILNLDPEKFSGKIEGNIPVILPVVFKEELKKSHLDEKSKSTFNYLEHYQKDAEIFDYLEEFDSKVTRDEVNRLNQKIVHHISDGIDTILDVGCGNGWLSRKLQNDSIHIISMDVSLINAQKALENQPYKNHSALVADVFHLPLAENSIDCIVASEIIEHVPYPGEFIRQLIRPLKKNGKLIITTPYNEHIPEYLCVHCNKVTPAFAHLHSFNEKNIQKIIPGGIQSWRYETFGNKYLPKLHLYHLIRKWPFKIWEKIDKLVNRLIKHPTRLMIEIVK